MRTVKRTQYLECDICHTKDIAENLEGRTKDPTGWYELCPSNFICTDDYGLPGMTEFRKLNLLTKGRDFCPSCVTKIEFDFREFLLKHFKREVEND